jgi:hypothetical protein
VSYFEGDTIVVFLTVGFGSVVVGHHRAVQVFGSRPVLPFLRILIFLAGACEVHVHVVFFDVVLFFVVEVGVVDLGQVITHIYVLIWL